MTVIKVCDYFLETKLNPDDASEFLESKIVDYICEMDEDCPFNLDDFIDDLSETSNKFEVVEDSNDFDVEYTPEQIDEIVEDACTSHQDSGADEEDGEDDYFDDDDEDDEE